MVVTDMMFDLQSYMELGIIKEAVPLLGQLFLG